MTGSVYVWAYIISQNWDVYAPGFTSLASNVEYVESETEFDLNSPDEDEQSKQPIEPAEVCLLPSRVDCAAPAWPVFAIRCNFLLSPKP